MCLLLTTVYHSIRVEIFSEIQARFQFIFSRVLGTFFTPKTRIVQQSHSQRHQVRKHFGCGCWTIRSSREILSSESLLGLLPSLLGLFHYIWGRLHIPPKSRRGSSFRMKLINNVIVSFLFPEVFTPCISKYRQLSSYSINLRFSHKI